jgi:DNA-binding NtrC family response regulator
VPADSPLSAPAFAARLAQGVWPGNVRELRNYLERCVAFEDTPPMSDLAPAQEAVRPAVDTAVPYAEGRRRAIEGWEHAYVDALLLQHGSVERAADAAGLSRSQMYHIVARRKARAPGAAG